MLITFWFIISVGEAVVRTGPDSNKQQKEKKKFYTSVSHIYLIFAVKSLSISVLKNARSLVLHLLY
jgi:hypothetical protein